MPDLTQPGAGAKASRFVMMQTTRTPRHNKNEGDEPLNVRQLSASSLSRLSFLTGTVIAVLPVLLLAQELPTQDPSAGQDPLPENVTPDQALIVDTPAAPGTADQWRQDVDRLIQDIRGLRSSAIEADSYYQDLDRVLQARVHRINQRMKDARSPLDPIYAANELPPAIRTISDLHVDIDGLYDTRLRLLPYLSSHYRLQVTSTDVIGVEQLSLEFNYIWEQVRFRGLLLPAAGSDLWRRIQFAPLPFVWQLIKFVLVIGLFVWWRSWFPETLRRMRTSLSEIRPRSAAIMRRIRAIWYIDQLRKPLEWMLVAEILFAMVSMPGLAFFSAILAVIVRWILLGWFAVVALNAVAARGDAGLTGSDATLRLRSLRLVTTWMVLLGLGLSLAESLAGVATLHAWVWRLFQVLALPGLIVLLAWWRAPIFERLERESETTDSVQKRLQYRSGLRSFTGAATGAVWLIANSLRRRVMRMFLQVGADQAIALSGNNAETGSENAEESHTAITRNTRDSLLRSADSYERYGRSERRKLVQRVSGNLGGVVVIVGERGIGKSAFIAGLRSALDDKLVQLEVNSGKYAELETELGDALGMKRITADKITAKLAELDTRVVVIDKFHRMVRPIIDGQAEADKLAELVENTGANILWIVTVDCFAWQFLRRIRADQSGTNEIIELPAWTEEQLTELIDQRNQEAEIQPLFEGVHIPDEHVVTSLDTAEARNKAGVYRMIWTLSNGNPAVALRMWANCLYIDEKGNHCVATPGQLSSRELDAAPHNVLLVLRVIAQSEVISLEDIADNLRLPAGAVGSAMHFCLSRGWIDSGDGRYSLSMDWFRTITRVLARQNLLAR